MNFIYFGSFRLSADILELLIAGGFTPSAVICSPDRPAGRKQIVTAPAVKQFVTTYNEQLATDKKIKILQPEKAPDVIPELKKLGADFFVVMGYPQIISQDILDIPRLGTIGVHPSLLPKYRGASPIQTALLHDEVETGVTLYQMDAKMDHGDIISNDQFPISNDETNASLEKKAAKVAASLLIETLPKFIAGKITPIEQDHTKATFTKKFTTADGQVDMMETTYNKQLTINNKDREIYNKIRAFNPEPSVWTMNFPGYEGKRVKLLAATLLPSHPEQGEGSILKVTEILPEGKKPIRL